MWLTLQHQSKWSRPELCDRELRSIGPSCDKRLGLLCVCDVQREWFIGASTFCRVNGCDAFVIFSSGADPVHRLGRKDNRSAGAYARDRRIDEVAFRTFGSV